MELREIYLFQAKHCIEKINRLLHEETKDFSDKQYNQYKIIVGEEALAWVIDTSIMYMNILQNMEMLMDSIELVILKNDQGGTRELVCEIFGKRISYG